MCGAVALWAAVAALMWLVVAHYVIMCVKKFCVSPDLVYLCKLNAGLNELSVHGPALVLI